MEYIILIISLVGIVFGADFLVTGAVSIARKYKVSDFVIGAAIIGVGTSMPEMTVSFLGALNGNADVAIGNVVGSNIFNVFGILGLTAIFFPITFRRDKQAKPQVTQPKEGQLVGPMWISILKVVGGLAVLVFSCDVFVDNAVLIAKSFGVSDSFISLTLIACGTSLPELAASIAAAIKKNTSMALGNIVGSNIFNIALILGLCSQVSPLTSTGIGLVDFMVMIAAALVLFVFGKDCKISRGEGTFLFMCFVAYNWYLISIQIA